MPIPIDTRKKPVDVKVYVSTGEGVAITWSDGHTSRYDFPYLRDNCPCASCREEQAKPPDPFRILKPNELVPLAPVAMAPVGRYAYKITWSDGHDTGIFSLDLLRSLCQCPQCVTTR